MNNQFLNNKISFIYFDVGGVIIKDFSATNNWDRLKREDLGFTDQTIIHFDQIWQQYSQRLSLDVDVDDLVPKLSLPDGFSILDQFIKRFEKNQSIWPIMQSVKEKYRIGLLTDMYPRMFNAIKAAGLFPPVEWDVIIDSSVEKVRKPDPEMYTLAEVRAEVKPEEILFIDNVQKNLDPTISRGWSTVWYDSSDYEKSSKDLMDMLKKLWV